MLNNKIRVFKERSQIKNLTAWTKPTPGHSVRWIVYLLLPLQSVSLFLPGVHCGLFSVPNLISYHFCRKLFSNKATHSRFYNHSSHILYSMHLREPSLWPGASSLCLFSYPNVTHPSRSNSSPAFSVELFLITEVPSVTFL